MIIKVNEAYNNILANILLLGWGQKDNLFSFLKEVILHNQINQKEAYNTMHPIVLSFYTPLTPV